MKFANLLLTCLATLAAPLHAAILTVDSNPGAVAQFTNFPAAYAAASDGDTILLAGSSGYNGATIYKRLTIIGPGYFLNDNAIPGLSTQTASLPLTLSKDVLLGDASGTVLLGLDVNLTINSNLTGVRVEKCRFSTSVNVSSPVVIRQCFFGNSLNLSSGSSGSIVTNCILGSLNLGAANLSASHCIITTNFFAEPSTSISNSIFLGTSQGSIERDGSITNCLSIGGAFLPVGGGNINGPVLIGNVFLNTGSDDAKWQLKAGSPAIGTGTGGSNMGAFGGATPYVLSGVPGRPRLTRLVVPATATSSSGLQFEVDARAFTD